MKILVASPLHAGITMAYAINTVKMAEGFARRGHDVLFLTRDGQADAPDDKQLFETYGLKTVFDWQRVSRLHKEYLTFDVATVFAARRFKPDLVFARAFTAPAATALTGYPTVIETHAAVGHSTWPFRLAVKASRLSNFRLWVTIGEPLSDYYGACGVPRSKLKILPTGVNVQNFLPGRALPSPYPGRRPVAAYVGHLYDYKGIPAIFDAAAASPDIDFHLVGGLPDDLARQRTKAAERGLDNVVFHGFKSQSELPPYLWHADVLLLPPSANHPSAKWTSPVKLGEYLASETPVVATRIKALEYWLRDSEVQFAAPDSGASLSEGIRAVLNDPVRAQRLTQNAKAKALSWSYEQRAAHITDCALGAEAA